MNRYIDARKLLNEVRNYCKTVYCQPSKTEAELQSIIDRQPSADVQPVVHCKDCWKRGTEHCSVNMPYKDKLIIAKVDDNFFCKGGDEHDNG